MRISERIHSATVAELGVRLTTTVAEQSPLAQFYTV